MVANKDKFGMTPALEFNAIALIEIQKQLTSTTTTVFRKGQLMRPMCSPITRGWMVGAMFRQIQICLKNGRAR